MFGRSRLISIIAVVALSLALAATASAKPVHGPLTVKSSAALHVSSSDAAQREAAPTALPMGHVSSSDAAQRDAAPVATADTSSPDSGGLSTLAIVLIAAAGGVALASLGAAVGRHSRTGVPTT